MPHPQSPQRRRQSRGWDLGLGSVSAVKLRALQGLMHEMLDDDEDLI